MATPKKKVTVKSKAKATPAVKNAKVAAKKGKEVVEVSKQVTAEEIVRSLAHTLALLRLFDGPAGDPLPGTAGTLHDAAVKVTEPDTDEDESDEEDVEDDNSERRAELEKMGIRALKKLAKQFFDDEEVDDAEKAELVDNILDAESDSEDEEDEEEDEDSDEEEEESDEEEEEEEDDEEEEGDEDEESELHDRDELSDSNLTALKKIAVEDGYDKSDLAGYTKDDMLDLLCGEAEEEEESEEDEDEEEEDEEGDVIDPDSLQEMSLAQLKKLAGEYDIRLPKGVKKPGAIKKILEAAE